MTSRIPLCLHVLQLAFFFGTELHPLTAQETLFANRLAVAERLFESGDLSQAATEFHVLAAGHPQEPQPHWYLGLIAYQQGQQLQARNHFRALVERQEEAGAGWAMLGLAEFRLKEYDEALPHLELGRFLGIANNETLSQTAALHQAFLCNRVQRFDVALAVLSELAVQGRRTPAIQAAFGIAALNRPWLLEDVPRADQPMVMEAGEVAWLLGARRQQEAAQRAEALVEKYPNQPGVQFILGTTLVRADWQRAETSLLRETATNPNHYFAHITLASELADRGRAGDAIPFAQRAVQLRPESFVAQALLGKALLGADKTAEAVAALEEAVKLAPSNPNVRYSLALAYTRLGRKDEAAAQRRIFTELQQRPQTPNPASHPKEQP